MSTEHPATALHRRDLHEGWTLSVTDGPAPFAITDVPATVPGTFMTDLLDAGLIPDPYVDRNEADLAWTGECDVAYRTTFTWQPATPRAERVDLVAAGLDTVAAIVLNGEEIARVQNQHRSYRIDVTDVLRSGENELEIRFTAPLRAMREAEEQLGSLPQSGNILGHRFNALRKMACNFGWDWGPTLLTSGIIAPIGLEEWSGARLAQVRPRVDVDGETGRLRVHTSVERSAPDGVGAGDVGSGAPAADGSPSDGALKVRVRLVDPDGAECGATTARIDADGEATLDLEVPQVRRWWPRGYGEQALYTVHVDLVEGAAESSDEDAPALDARTHRVGFRTAGVREEADEIGTSFVVTVNDRPILAKGANWIPEDCFPTRLRPEDYRARLQDAVDANMNMLRIWGGGLYESDVLYDLADEMGLLVWQDFTLACAAYSEKEPLRSEIEAEARENIVRLAWHPSLVHWNGSNENVEGYWTWGWREELPEGTGWGDLYYSQIFPSLLEELDGTRSYTPSSPFSRPVPSDPKNPDHGTVHDWRIWNQVDYTRYRDMVPRFSAEFGFQGPANRATIERAVTERPLDADSPTMLAHQKAFEGQDKLRKGYAPHLPEPTGWPDFHATTQLNQARALICGISHYRSHWPVCGGTIVWQLNDCWPVTSWAAVDGDGRRKLLWHALAHVYAPVLLSVEPREDGLIVSIGNDTDEVIDAELRLTRRGYDGEEIAASTQRVHAEPRTSTAVPVPAELARADAPEREVLVAELLPAAGGAERALHWFAEDRDAALRPDALQASAERDGQDVLITLTASGAVKDVCVFADAAAPEAAAERQLISLLPGEQAVLRVLNAGDAHPQEFLREDVLISANDLVARGDAGANRPADAADEGTYAGPSGTGGGDAYAGPTS